MASNQLLHSSAQTTSSSLHLCPLTRSPHLMVAASVPTNILGKDKSETISDLM